MEYDSIIVDDPPGEQWISSKKKFGEKEEIKIEVTMFDRSIHVEKSTKGIPSGPDVELHITLIVNISKGEGSDALEFVCSAWPDCIEIVNVLVHGKGKTWVLNSSMISIFFSIYYHFKYSVFLLRN